MNQLTEVEIPKLSVAELEFRLLKRNALFSLILGVMFIIDPVYALLELYTSWAEIAGKILPWLMVPSIIYIFFTSVPLWVDSWKIQGMHKIAGFEDEYSQHVNSMSQAAALGTLMVIGLVNYTASGELIVLLGTYFTKIIWGAVFTAYGATSLYLLREDNE